MFGKKEIDLNLRSEPDKLIKSIGRFSLVSWSLTLIAFVVTCLAMPVVRKFLTDTFNLELKKGWSTTLYQIDFYLFTAIFIVSGLGLLLNSLRHRRRTDRYNYSLVYFVVLSALCMIGYLIFFKSIR
jgi:peptidoglycan biosynthesis protein MviN/MurJ (putative lipid II flippase)